MDAKQAWILMLTEPETYHFTKKTKNDEQQIKDKHGHVVISVVCRKRNSKSFYCLGLRTIRKIFI